MKKIFYLLFCCLVFCNSKTYTQKTNPSPIFTANHFKVFGACDQCKARIEAAAKILGVKSAEWDVDTKQLSITYNPAQVSVEKIQNRSGWA
jgi:outer membrane receptor for ferrienterochelin and colicins